MVTSLQRAGLLPQRLPLGRSRGAVWRPPAGLAIELETHVAKRCLLAGTAGGFAEIVLGQTLLPTVRSAILAAEAAMAALKDDRPQEALGDFKTSWRDSLGGWLRPLPTPLHMLLPMLPANRKLAAKLTAQLLRGDRS
jgi:flavin-dependent dehydrogenase